MSAVIARSLKQRRKAWTEEEAREWYAKAREKLGRAPTMEEMVPYQNAFIRLFGSIGKFQAACGDEPRVQGRPKGGNAT